MKIEKTTFWQMAPEFHRDACQATITYDDGRFEHFWQFDEPVLEHEFLRVAGGRVPVYLHDGSVEPRVAGYQFRTHLWVTRSAILEAEYRR